jgi:hypothetical protein
MSFRRYDREAERSTKLRDRNRKAGRGRAHDRSPRRARAPLWRAPPGSRSFGCRSRHRLRRYQDRPSRSRRHRPEETRLFSDSTGAVAETGGGGDKIFAWQKRQPSLNKAPRGRPAFATPFSDNSFRRSHSPSAGEREMVDRPADPGKIPRVPSGHVLSETAGARPRTIPRDGSIGSLDGGALRPMRAACIDGEDRNCRARAALFKASCAVFRIWLAPL